MSQAEERLATAAATPASNQTASTAAQVSSGTQAQDASSKGSQQTPSLAMEPSDEVVMNYLRKRGMGNAMLELSQILRDRRQKQASPSLRAQLEMDEKIARNQRTLLSQATGGGFGYDLDGLPSVAQWGVPDILADGGSDQTDGLGLEERMGRDEARAYVDSFTALQTWVLSLPDDPAGMNKTQNISQNTDGKKDTLGISISSLAKRAATGSGVPNDVLDSAKKLDDESVAPWMPPSAKPELLAVSFALLVHTYCELLEVRMEPTAKRILDVFSPVYESIYEEAIADLRRCNSTEAMIRLKSHNSDHIDSLSKLKVISLQISNFEGKRAELKKDPSSSNPQLAAAKQRKVAEYERNIQILKQKQEEVARRAAVAAEKTKEFPFLRRARAVRWQLTLSSSSYGMLATFLSSRELFLPISTMLQTKCEIHVDRRDPLPYTPPCVLDDMVPDKGSAVKEVRWAAPVPPAARLAAAGEDVDKSSILGESVRLPFPRYHLEEEYGSQGDADAAKHSVEFNRALLVHGFRRLEAIERKQEYEVGMHPAVDESKKTEGQPVGNPLEPSILLSTLCSSSSPGPSMLNTSSRSGAMSMLWEESGVGISCARLSPPDGRRVAAGCDDGAVRIWSIYDSIGKEEGNSGSASAVSSSDVSETAIVLLGHKNGFPVFDLDWNRDGRTLLSAGGDGSVRLWDTMAVGPYGHLAKVSQSNAAASMTSKAPPSNAESCGMVVPGERPESDVEPSGAALAVYRGHAPSSPIWSVAFAPSGFYFASAGSDGTARVWTTDRPAPVRILAGHTSPSVNTIAWHPNCNYVVTGSDDKTVRLWDIQSGQCVRLMSGCAKGVSVVAVCPSGRYVSGADHSGKINIWDLGSGKKVNELNASRGSLVGSKREATGAPKWKSSPCVIHSLSYSACGTALAAGGDDSTVRIWDVRGVAENMSNPEYAASQGWGEGLLRASSRPVSAPSVLGDLNRPGTRQPAKMFATRDTLIMDLKFTKRNLLLSAGKYVAPLPVKIAD